jgi:hypothetical protein
MRTSGWRDRVVLLALLTLTVWASACSQRQPEDDERSAPVPTTRPSTIPSATPSPSDVPNNHELGVALPGPSEIGGIGGYSSCISGVQVCYDEDDTTVPDPDLSWVRATEGVKGGPGARWAALTVDRAAEPGLVREVLWLARGWCPVGEFVVPAEPRGFIARGPLGGTGRRHPVKQAGFRGIRCAMEIGPLGDTRHKEYWIMAARDDVQLHVSASSERLVARLFDEYLVRLGWTR